MEPTPTEAGNCSYGDISPNWNTPTSKHWRMDYYYDLYGGPSFSVLIDKNTGATTIGVYNGYAFTNYGNVNCNPDGDFACHTGLVGTGTLTVDPVNNKVTGSIVCTNQQIGTCCGYTGMSPDIISSFTVTFS